MKASSILRIAVTHPIAACNHPSLLSKDFLADKEAVEPKAAKSGQDVEDADDLAELFGQMGVSSTRKCQVCQTTYVACHAFPLLSSKIS